MNKIKNMKKSGFVNVFANIILLLFVVFSCSVTPGADNSEQTQIGPTDSSFDQAALDTELSSNAASVNPDQWELIFSDEFNYTGKPDPAKWTYDIGIGAREDGWGSWEAQYYTDNLRNASVGNGVLSITALKENYGSIIPATGADHRRSYTSARLITRGKAHFTYGRFEFRAKLPSGRGTWPAIWMLGAEFDEYNWPACGEIDIVEHVGTDPDGVLGGIHCTDYNFQDYTAKNHTQTVPTAETAFHDYALEWDSEKIEIFIDGQKHFTFYNEHRGVSSWPFNNPLYLILNIAIGGGWGGQLGIDDSIFPQSMLIDYVRVYRKLPSATITANGENAPNETKEMAFDGYNTTKWLTFADTGWITYDFAGDTAKVIKSYSITTANDAASYPERDPKDWRFEGSNNGTSWTVLDTRSGETFSGNYHKKSYNCTNNTAYKMYRLFILSNKNPAAANSIQIAEIGLSENTTVVQNLVLSANGGVLENFTSEYGGGWNAACLTDGIINHDGWSSKQYPGTQEFVYSFKDGCTATLNEAVIYSGNAEGRYFSKNVQVWTSANGTSYTQAASGTLANSINSITLNLGGVSAKKVKLVITSGYRSDYWELGEFVVNGILDQGSKNVIPTGIVALKACSNNKFVCADLNNYGLLINNRTSVGAWEKFRLVPNTDGTVSLLALANNKYVCAENQGNDPLAANRASIGAWEKFRYIAHADGSISLQSTVNNKYVCAENNGTTFMAANRTAIGPWEKFILINQ